jgi:hypothetical protein
MMQSQPQTTSLFRTSLRDWQARFKARQEGQAAPEQPPAREKKLVARKRRKMRQSSGEATS